MINLYMVIPFVFTVISINACSSQTTPAQNNNSLNYEQTTESNQIAKPLNVKIKDKLTAKSTTILNKTDSQYFTQTEISELSQAFKHDSCDMTKFNQQTKKNSFSNNYGNPYADGQDSIDELNKTSSCLLVQHAKINTFNNRFLVDDKNSNKLQSTEVDLKSNTINKIIFSIDYSKFPSCNIFQSKSPFTIVFLKNDSGDIERSINKSEYENFDCYENAMTNMLAINKRSFEIDKKWQGLYGYSTYQTVENKGTAVGENYTIRISNDECQIDIVGYQVDRHFECFVTQNNDSNYINIFQLDNNDKFGEIKYKQPNDYSINVTYYDEYSEIDNSFVPLEKSDRISN